MWRDDDAVVAVVTTVVVVATMVPARSRSTGRWPSRAWISGMASVMAYYQDVRAVISE